MISAIVAVDENWGIGFNGELLEKIPEDLKYFKDLTSNHVVVMGRKTWDSLPDKPLKDRINIIISNSLFQSEYNQPWDVIKHLSVCMSLDYAINYIQTVNNDNDVFIIGGGQIYKELLPFCDRVYVTKIYTSHENVDTYFPNLDEPEEWDTWKVVHQSKTKIYNNILYQFWTYDRIS